MKRLLLICVFALFGAGCAIDQNCVMVEKGMPFVAQPGMRYAIPEGGITYHFEPSSCPQARVIYADPGRGYELRPGGVFVMFMDPTYPERKRRQDEADARAMEDMQKSMKDAGNSMNLNGMFNEANQTLNNMHR